MSVVEQAFAALSPEQWSSAASASDPRAELRRRIKAGVCPACGLRARAPRHNLCADCEAAGLRYCASCETVKAADRFQRNNKSTWCRACQADRRRRLRGVASREEGQQRIRDARMRQQARADADPINRKIRRLRQRKRLPFREIAARVGLTTNNVKKRYRRMRQRNAR